MSTGPDHPVDRPLAAPDFSAITEAMRQLTDTIDSLPDRLGAVVARSLPVGVPEPIKQPKFDQCQLVVEGEGMIRYPAISGDRRLWWALWDPAGQPITDSELAATGDVRRVEPIIVPHETDGTLIEFIGRRVGLRHEALIRLESIRTVVENLLAAELALQHFQEVDAIPF